MKKDRHLDELINAMSDERHAYEFNIIVINTLVRLDKIKKRKRRKAIKPPSLLD